MWEFWEPCCGSAAVSLGLLGSSRALLPYQGSKWRLRHQIIDLIRGCGFEGPPSRVYLTDAPGSPWTTTWDALPHDRGLVLGHLRSMAERDPHDLYRALNKCPLPDTGHRFAAEHLALQRLAFSGKAVGISESRWSSPGFNGTSAYGKAATDRFGPIRPMLPVLIQTIEELPDLGGIRAMRPLPTDRRRVVLIDPPYVTGTQYPGAVLPRPEVVSMALGCGADLTIVCEGEPVQELVDLGWTAQQLSGPKRSGDSPFRGKNEEWITWSQVR